MNRESTATRKEDERKNIHYQIPLEVYQDKKETPRSGKILNKAQDYPKN